MSSPGAMPPPYDAVIYRDEHIVGPIRLPLINRDRFVAQFEQTYRRLGIGIRSIKVSSPSEVGASPTNEAREAD